MPIRGKQVVAILVLAGAALGGVSWWHAYHRGRRSLDKWGSQAAILIRYAPRVEVWHLSSGATERGDAALRIDDDSLTILSKTDISGVRGLVHARHALVEDTSFLWEPAAAGAAADWRFALSFVGAEGRATLVFDTRQGQVRLIERPRTAWLKPRLMANFAEKSLQWTAVAGERSTLSQ